MIDQRNKGRRNEMIVRDLYFDDMGAPLKRELQQVRTGQLGDLVPDGDFDWPFTIEVKSRSAKMLNVVHSPDWWKQTTQAAEAAGNKPVLWYKFDRREWRVVMLLQDVVNAFNEDHTLTLQRAATLTMSPFTHFYIAREILALRAAE